LQQTNLVFIYFLASFIATPFCYAEQEELPIEITAESLIIEEKTGSSVYLGNVIITQGKLKIKGDKVTVKHPNQQVSQAIVLGKPASFINFIEKDKTWVKGQANTITYQATNKNILFDGKAKITQAGKNSISGSSILYNSKKETITAKGNKQKQQRIKVIFTKGTTP